jgi:hypothetical protein
MKRVFWFYLQILSKIFLIPKRIRDIFINVKRSSCKELVILVRFLLKLWILSTKVWRNLSIKFHQTPSSGSRVDPRERTDMTKPTVAFRKFVNAPKNSLQHKYTARATSCEVTIHYTTLHCSYIGPQLQMPTFTITDLKEVRRMTANIKGANGQAISLLCVSFNDVCTQDGTQLRRAR